MNILHVLSQFEVTGAETFAATLADRQIRSGHRVWIVSDTFHTKTSATVFPLQIGKRNFRQRLNNIAALRKIIADLSIDVVHAHSRAASWVSYFATRSGNVPLVSTVHGRQHVHLSSQFFRIYGEKILPVCESIGDHLENKLHYSPDKISVVRNGIDLSRWAGAGKSRSKKSVQIISLVGRLSGPKGDIAQFIITKVFPALLKLQPHVELHVVGGMTGAEPILDSIRKINSDCGKEKIFFDGHRSDVEKVYYGSDVVIGSGRVAMEALASKCRVLAVGESNYIGIVSEQTSEEALRTNFGDAGEKSRLSIARCVDDLFVLLKNKPNKKDRWGYDFIEKYFDVDDTVRHVQKAYAEAQCLKARIDEIPVLMYHRVTETRPPGTRHGIYVTKDEFERQLAFLQRRSFTTLNFFNVRNILNGKKRIPRKPIILTFDDGYEDNYRFAFPLLKRFGMTATIFLLGNASIRRNEWDIQKGEPPAQLMTDDQIREMLSAGIEFGAHSMNHRILTQLPFGEANREIQASKKNLERRLDSEIISMAYPYGALNDDVKAAAAGAGFSFGIATDSGQKNFWKDLFEIRRIPIFPGASMFSYWKKTSGKYHSYKRIS